MRKSTIILAALAACLTPATALAQQNGDNLVYINGDDAEMNAAIAKARATLPDFFAHLEKPAAGEAFFAIKYDLVPEPDKAEFIWAEVVSNKDGVTIARLANDPLDPRFKIGDQVRVPDAEIIDWGYFRGKVMQGHHSTRVLLNHMDADEAAQVRAALGW